MKLSRSFFIMLILFFCSITSQAITLQTLDGDNIESSSLQGKWIFINYWASWCGPCLDEISELNRFYKDNKAGNVALFAVNYDAMLLSKQRRLVKQFNIQYPSLRRDSAAALHLGSVNVVPVTYVLNPKGELSATLYGGQTIESLKAAMT